MKFKENMGKPGRLDRYDHFQTCTTGEIAMGAASIRTRESFERLLKPIFRRQYQLTSRIPDSGVSSKKRTLKMGIQKVPRQTCGALLIFWSEWTLPMCATLLSTAGLFNRRARLFIWQTLDSILQRTCRIQSEFR